LIGGHPTKGVATKQVGAMGLNPTQRFEVILSDGFDRGSSNGSTIQSLGLKSIEGLVFAKPLREPPIEKHVTVATVNPKKRRPLSLQLDGDKRTPILGV